MTDLMNSVVARDKMIKRIWNYLVDHWQGHQSFALSFWVNLVSLRVVIFLLQEWLHPDRNSDYSARGPLVIGLVFLFHGVVFVWQIVGVLRAGEAHIRERGSMANVWGAQLGLLIAFWLTVSYAFEGWQTTLPFSSEDNYAERMHREHAGKYQIDASADGRTLIITGSIELGITREFAGVLERVPQAETVILNSDGGNIYAARGLSKLIRDGKLDTQVEEECSSACTTVFIGGAHRSLRRNARLGFHQYRIDADYDVLVADLSAEQERDRALYAKRNVKPWFLAKMHDSSAAEIWFPSRAELVRAGVVNRPAK